MLNIIYFVCAAVALANLFAGRTEGLVFLPIALIALAAEKRFRKLERQLRCTPPAQQETPAGAFTSRQG
jgi:hypothetical protein